MRSLVLTRKKVQPGRCTFPVLHELLRYLLRFLNFDHEVIKVQKEYLR